MERVETEGRAGRNQALFREINERVATLCQTFDQQTPQDGWACECADLTCTEPIEMTLAEYESVRKDSTHFAVAPAEDHVFPDVERLIQRTPRYWVVEKFGDAADVAEQSDPTA